MPSMSAENLKNDISNPAKVYLWDVVFSGLVGGGDRDHLELRAQSTAIPGRSFGEILVPFKGTPGVKYPGKLTMTHIWPCVFIEGTDQAVFDAIIGWQQKVQNARTGIGSLDSTIKKDVYLRLLDTAGTVIKKIKLVGSYPQAVDDVPIAYEDEGNIFYNITWSYDYWEPVD
jgi:hypothetical protein